MVIVKDLGLQNFGTYKSVCVKQSVKHVAMLV